MHVTLLTNTAILFEMHWGVIVRSLGSNLIYGVALLCHGEFYLIYGAHVVMTSQSHLDQCHQEAAINTVNPAVIPTHSDVTFVFCTIAIRKYGTNIRSVAWNMVLRHAYK